MERGSLTRRSFIGASAGAAAAALALSPRRAQSAPALERIGIGLIGCGGRGNHHLGVLAALKAGGSPLEIIAACDVYRPRLEKTAKAHGAKAYHDHRELLADPRVDAVCIATPDHLHGYQLLDALRAGKDVYCEKPLTHWRQLDLTRELQAEAACTGRVVQVGTQGLSDRAWSRAAQLVKEGAIGRPVHVECGYFRVGDWGERGMPIDDPGARPGPDLDWEAFLGDSPRKDFSTSRFFRWRMYLDYAGGPVTDLYPHTLAPVMKVLGVTFPSVVVATGGCFRYPEREVPDTFNLLIDFPESLTVAVLGTQANGFPGTGERGPGGRQPVIRGWEGTITFAEDGIVLRGVEGKGSPEARIPVERGVSEAAHWKDFLECCRSRRVPESPLGLGCHVQLALQMGMKSFLEGKAVRYEPAQAS